MASKGLRETEFSKYELREFGVKVSGDEAFTSADCVGQLEDEMDVIVVQKKCRGVVVTERPRGTGTGTVNYTGHMPYAIYAKIFDMMRDDLKDGVQGYGRKNLHKEFSAIGRVFNEDDEEMLIAYPRLIVTTGPNSNIENGAEEVAEIEMEIHAMPDENGYGKYETIIEDLGEEDKQELTGKWMTQFTPELVQKAPVI